MSRPSAPDTRTRILEQTQRLMETSQGRDVSMSQIAQAAGISRQGLYLHFPTRADLLIATTRHMDKVLDIEARLAPVTGTSDGLERLNAYVAFWGNYLPEIEGMARALIALSSDDAAAARAWNERMDALRGGCATVIDMLDREGRLAPEWTPDVATELLFSMIAFPAWEYLVGTCGWSRQEFIARVQTQATRALTIKK